MYLRYYLNYFGKTSSNVAGQPFPTFRLAKEATKDLPEDYAYIIYDRYDKYVVAYRTAGILNLEDFQNIVKALEKI